MELSLIVYIICFSLLGGVVSLGASIIIISRSNVKAGEMSHLISFAAGALLAAAFLDLLPEAIELASEPHDIIRWALFGFVAFFLMETLFHANHDDAAHIDTDSINNSAHHDLSHAPIMITIADSIHNFLDGVAIAAAFLVNIPLGIVTTFAVAAHEIPQELSDMSVQLHAGWSKSKVIIWNIISSLASLGGALLTVLASSIIEGYLGALLALSAGFFIYISASDLVPELHRKTRRDKLSHAITFFIVGILVVGVLVHFAHLE